LGKAAFSDVSFPFSANVVLSKVPWTNEIRCLGARRTNYSRSLSDGRAPFSSLVKTFAIDLIAGAAKSTIGTMIAQAASQEVNHALVHEVSAARRKHEMAEAIADVIPDWITANKKCA
jgi:hypothetical protein